MAQQNEWKVIAAEYRNREHNLLKKLLSGVIENQGDLLDILEAHLKATGRTLESPLEAPETELPDPDIQRRLLALLGATQGQQTVSSGPKLNKDGTPRKQRSDKGKKRGSYK